MRKVLILILLLCSTRAEAWMYNPSQSQIQLYSTSVLTTDSSGFANNSTSTSGTTTTGVFGGGIAFNGTSQFTTQGTNLNSVLTASPVNLTHAFWVKRFQTTGYPIFVACHSPANTGGYYIYVNATTGIVGLVACLGATWLSFNFSASPTAIAVGTWAHVAITLQGAVGKIFINGVEAGTQTGTRTYLGASPSPMYYARNITADSYFGGAIDDMRFYSVALDSSDIKRIMYGLHPLNK